MRENSATAEVNTGGNNDRMSAREATNRPRHQRRGKPGPKPPADASPDGEAISPIARKPALADAEGGPARVVLRPGRARPLWFGHPWVYGNAVAHIEGDAEPGDIVALLDSDRRVIGRGMWSPRSQIPVRVLSRQEEEIDEAFFVRRFRAAEALRAALKLPSAETTAYRLVNSEGDGLPGLVVDVFGKTAVLQFTTLGLWRRKDAIVTALHTVLAPAAIVQVGSGAYGDVEGFSAEFAVLRGKAGATLACREEGIELEVDPSVGQKTGMFVDQRENRKRVGALARGRRVLDCYAYAGGFSLQAARGGAREVVAVDSSARAVARIAAHAEKNRVAIRAVEADVFRFLETATPNAFDLVVLDPPKFARARKDLDAARKGYERLNALALRTCAPGAILVTCSCSQNVSAEDLERIVAAAAKQAGRSVSLFDSTGAGSDHPVPAGFTEGRYLKALFAFVA